jgi:pectinesterase
MITVATDGSGDFSTVSEAIKAVTELPETIFIKKGIYKERVEIDKPFLTLEGEDRENTVITEGFYANMIMEDGIKRGTFRSYTLIVTADNVTLKNLTIENSSGFGTDVGQAIALYVEGDRALVENCRLLGHQDTLFTGPLPHEVIQSGGFTGPTEFSKRRILRQEYRNCYIEGEVDFIFGSACAYFENCEIHSLNRNMDINGYVTAPSTYEGMEFGYVFQKCRFTSNCPENTVYLGRPWRIYAKTVILNSQIDAHITDAAFHDWNKPESHETTFFALYQCTGKNFSADTLADYVHILTDEQAAAYTRENVLKKL